MARRTGRPRRPRWRATRSNFDGWRRILTAEAIKSDPSPPPAFVPVRVVAEPMAEVVLRTGLVVRIPLGALPDAVNLLARDFAPPRPNAAWSADMTSIPTAYEWLYLVVVEDLFNPWHEQRFRDAVDRRDAARDRFVTELCS